MFSLKVFYLDKYVVIIHSVKKVNSICVVLSYPYLNNVTLECLKWYYIYSL